MTCAHTSTGLVVIARKRKTRTKGKERREGEAETAGFVRRYPAPVVEKGLMATWQRASRGKKEKKLKSRRGRALRFIKQLTAHGCAWGYFYNA